MIDEKERKWIETQIRNLESLIKYAKPDNPDIKRWQQEIINLNLALTD